MLTVTKKFGPFPAGHRQHTHDGHCAFGHGHDLVIDLTFSSKELDETGFVIDFGKMQYIKNELANQFDHTFLLCEDDPELPAFKEMAERGVFDIRVMKAVSAEAMAEWVLDLIGSVVTHETEGRVKLTKVVVWEDSKNCATLENN